MSEKYKKRKAMVKVKPIDSKEAASKLQKKPTGKLDTTKRKGATTTYKGKDGFNYTTPGAMQRANMKFDARSRKARGHNPSIGKGTQEEKDAVKKRRDRTLGK